MNPKNAFIACVLACAAAAPVAQAQQAAPRQLTRDEYRACMDTQDQLFATRDSLHATAAEITKENDALKAEHEELVAAQKRAEENQNTLAMNGVERRQRAFTGKAKALQAKSDAWKASSEALVKGTDDYNAKCSNVAIQAEDKEAVTKERAAAGKK